MSNVGRWCEARLVLGPGTRLGGCWGKSLCRGVRLEVVQVRLSMFWSDSGDLGEGRGVLMVILEVLIGVRTFLISFESCGRLDTFCSE